MQCTISLNIFLSFRSFLVNKQNGIGSTISGCHIYRLCVWIRLGFTRFKINFSVEYNSREDRQTYQELRIKVLQ